ncbi:aldo/keto reductase, partial [Ralstonia pseudosolanacearum]|uniref:aldo/keto reductase n=1 Tax=Ralstonia pseudosolanacearum TaxID=1310165 RepID=UPI003D180448
MEYRYLGRSALKVSPLCLGAMMFGGETDEATATRIIGKAFDQGINFIDTAAVSHSAVSVCSAWRRCVRASSMTA